MELEDNETNELLWSPNNFGSYSVEKVNLIADIMKNLLKDVTINVKGTMNRDEESYTKKEVNDLLKDYLLRADYGDVASPAIHAETNSYLENLRNQGKMVDKSITDNLVMAADYWTKCCLSMTYSELINSSVPPSVSSFNSRLDNLEGIQGSHTTYLSKIMSDMYSDPSLRVGVKFSSKKFTGEVDGAVIGTASNKFDNLLDAVNDLIANSPVGTVTMLSGTVASLSTQVNNLTNRVDKVDGGNMALSKSDIVTSSINDTTKVAAASLEYEDRNNISDLSNKIGNLSYLSSDISDKSDLVRAINSLQSYINSEISTISSKISMISGKIDDININIKSLDDRLSKLENSTEVDELSSRVDGISGDVGNLSNRVDTIRSDMSSINDRVTALESSNSSDGPDTEP